MEARTSRGNSYELRGNQGRYGTWQLWRPTEFPGALCKTVHGNWQFCKFNGVFREAELIHLKCCHLEIHLYQLFLELVCSTDIVWSWYIIWCVVWFRALCCVNGSWMFTLLVEPMHNYLLNSFSMDMASRLAIMVSCWYFWTVRSYSWIRFSFIYNYFLEWTK